MSVGDHQIEPDPVRCPKCDRWVEWTSDFDQNTGRKLPDAYCDECIERWIEDHPQDEDED